MSTVKFESNVPNTYTLYLEPGSYTIDLVGGGGGFSSYNHHYASGVFRRARISQGGTGAWIHIKNFIVMKQQACTIVVGAAGAYGYIYSVSQWGYGGVGGVSSFKCIDINNYNTYISAHGGNVGTTGGAGGTCEIDSSLSSEYFESHNGFAGDYRLSGGTVSPKQSPYGNNYGLAGGASINYYNLSNITQSSSGYVKIVQDPLPTTNISMSSGGSGGLTQVTTTLSAGTHTIVVGRGGEGGISSATVKKPSDSSVDTYVAYAGSNGTNNPASAGKAGSGSTQNGHAGNDVNKTVSISATMTLDGGTPMYGTYGKGGDVSLDNTNISVQNGNNGYVKIIAK